MVTWTKAAQGAIIVVLLLYCFLEAQRALPPSPPAADPTPPAASSSPTGKFRPASDFPAEPGSDWTPTRCLLPRAPLPRRACRPRCAFDANASLACAVWERGSFRGAARAQAPRRRCAGGDAAGAFEPRTGFEWVHERHRAAGFEWTAKGCALRTLTRGNVLGCLRGERVLFLGDSMVRQLFYSVSGAMRRAKHVVDYDAWVPAYYTFGDDGDEFGIVPWANHTATDLERYLGRSLADRATAEYVVSPTYTHITEALSGYWGRLPRDARVTVVLGPMFWEQKAKVPARFLREISDVLGDKRLRRLLVLGTPSTRLTKRKAEWQDIIPRRNAMLQAWVRRTREGGRDAQKLGFVDYDALAKDADSAKSVPGVANGNWHYQCFLHWKNIPDHQMPTPATYQGVGEIYSLEDGTCTDDMNRGVLKVILHEVCAAKA